MYINKSIKGKSIISNLDIEGELNVNTDITTEQGSTFDIGSNDNTFKTLYIDEIYVNDEPYIKPTATAPINVSQGNISLQINPRQFSTTGNVLNSTLQTTSPLNINSTTNALSLSYGNTLTLSGGTLQTVTTVNAPINFSGGNIGLNVITTGNLRISNGSLATVNQSATFPMFVATTETSPSS